MDNKIICFHNSNEENGYLSNWYISKFEVDGIEYTSMEQYMMYQKAITFKDKVTANKILNTTDVRTIKALGREVRNYNDTVWNGMRQIIVYKGLIAKFTGNAQLRTRLIDTGDNILAECAVQDRIWGIGISMNDTRRFNINQWCGKNLLGFALMQVREELVK